jgi:predicted ester cyclase
MRNVQATTSYRWFQEVWNNGRREAINDFLTEDVKAHGLYEDDVKQGIDTYRSFYDDFRKVLKDIHIDVEDVIVQDDVESTRCMVTAVDVASGKQVKFSGICHVRIRDGKIAEAWNNFDFLKMYQQLGQVMIV